MGSYLSLKLLHILAAVVVTGTGAGIAFFMLMAYRSKNIQVICVTTRHVILADWIFTSPAVLVQLTTGYLLMQQLQYSFRSIWFISVICLIGIIALCWLPVLCIQYQLHALAKQALAVGKLCYQFEQLMRYWMALGTVAFSAILGIFWLMLFKPKLNIGAW